MSKQAAATATTPTDLASLDIVAASDKPARFEIRHPVTNKPLGSFVSVYGRDSTVFRDHIRETQNERIRQAAMLRKRAIEPDLPTMEEQEKEVVDLLVAATADFDNVILDGAPLSFSPDNARRLYTRFPWLRGQVDRAIGDVQSFLKG